MPEIVNTYLIPGLITAVIIPFFAPLCMDILAAWFIMLMNRAKGKPTWVVGTRFRDVILPNAGTIGECYINNVTWKFVILKCIGKPGTFRIKKRKLMKCDCIAIDSSIVK